MLGFTSSRGKFFWQAKQFYERVFHYREIMERNKRMERKNSGLGSNLIFLIEYRPNEYGYRKVRKIGKCLCKRNGAKPKCKRIKIKNWQL